MDFLDQIFLGDCNDILKDLPENSIADWHIYPQYQRKSG